MGEVFLADDTSLGRQVALKFLPPGVRREDVAHKRFVREARAVATLSHPYICAVHEVVEAEGHDFIVMEYVEGRTLRERLAEAPVPLREALRIASEIAEALEEAHARGVIHRDLKPSNIMLAQQGHVKVMDFGLAKRVHEVEDAVRHEDTATSLTAEGTTLGTLAYMSPEQLRGQAVDERSDLFSFGVVLYETVTGAHPFRQATPVDTVAEILDREPLPLSRHVAGVPEALERLVRRLLAKDPVERYAGIREVRADLGRFIQQLAVGEGGPTTLLRRTLGTPYGAIPALALVVALGWVAVTAIRDNRNARWAREVALPEAQRAIERDDYTTAFRLVERAGRYIPQDPGYLDLAPQTRGTLSLRTNPSGAEVRLRDYERPDGEWELIGRAPLRGVRVPRGFKRWKASLPGYEAVEGATYVYGEESHWAPDLEVTLDRIGTLPPGMVRVQGGTFRPTLLETLPELELAAYLLDRYETTNRQFKEFVDAGGYRRPEFWKHGFVKDGRALSFEAAMRLLVDGTGRPGPSTWELGGYPEGQAEYPVSGVSWYEAAAFAQFAGKSLPTVHHWNYAAVNVVDPDIQNTDYLAHQIVLSNFAGKGPAPAGRFQGVTPHGLYDMAGNVKEWGWNELKDGGQRIILGGAWNEAQYMYSYVDRYPPFLREPNFGFRCMKRLVEDGGWRQAALPVSPDPQPSFDLPKPCSDEVLQAYRKLYDYPRSDLRPRIEASQDVDAYTRLESVSFDAAYADERVVAYLFLPSRGRPPFQAVIHFPGGAAPDIPRTLDYAYGTRMRFVTRTGRAWVLPVMWGTFERRISPGRRKKTSQFDQTVMQVKDFRRTIDYLETRPDIDAGKLAFEGLSWGAWFGAVLPGIEERLKAAVLYGGGVNPDLPPEYSQANFAPRIRIPVLMQNGRYDFIFPLDASARPLLRLFGTPERDKELRVYETGHAVWTTNELYRDEVAFLDEHLGPAR
jgi:formylglycine-generating enzyme required for sulfatase activity/dienelactone hydrolase/predicted Ser/Thr protein kinase